MIDGLLAGIVIVGLAQLPWLIALMFWGRPGAHGGGGGGEGWRQPAPPPPDPDGLEQGFDWDGFERDFRLYAREQVWGDRPPGPAALSAESGAKPAEDSRGFATGLLAGPADAATAPAPEVRPAPLPAAPLRAPAVPGLEIVEGVRDRAGRTGIGVSYLRAGYRHELIFDADTSELLEERTVVVDPAVAGPEAAAGDEVEWTVYLGPHPR